MKKTFLIIVASIFAGSSASAQNDANLKSQNGKPQLATEKVTANKSDVRTEKPAPVSPAAGVRQDALKVETPENTKPTVVGSPVMIDRYDPTAGTAKTEYQSKSAAPPALPQKQEPGAVSENKPPVKPTPVIQVEKNR